MTVDILAFGAHPDDVELAAAGTLIQARREGASTGLVSLTRGEMSTRGTPETRAAEFDAASVVESPAPVRYSPLRATAPVLLRA